MLTPWAAEAERQLRLLGWAMRFIEDNTVLPAAVLNQSLSRRERPVFEPDEAVEIVLRPAGHRRLPGSVGQVQDQWQTSSPTALAW